MPFPFLFPFFSLLLLLLFIVLLLFDEGTCGVNADDDCCDSGRCVGDIECGRLFDDGELALRLCDDNAGGLLLKLLSGGPIEFEFD